MSTSNPNPNPVEHSPAEPRILFTIEICGGTEKMRNICSEIFKVEMERTKLILDSVHGHRKGAPKITVHPLSLEA